MQLNIFKMGHNLCKNFVSWKTISETQDVLLRDGQMSNNVKHKMLNRYKDQKTSQNTTITFTHWFDPNVKHML